MVPGGDVIQRDDASCVWSPDSSLVAFIADRELNSVEEVHVATAAGGSLLRVSQASVNPASVPRLPIWHSSSTLLAYDAQHLSPQRDLFFGVVASPPTQVTDSTLDGLGSFCTDFTLDASRFVFVRAVSGAGEELRSAPSGTGSSVTIAGPFGGQTFQIAVK